MNSHIVIPVLSTTRSITSICASIILLIVVPLAGSAPAVGFTEIEKLTASDGTQNDTFGRALSVDGQLALVGAPNDRSQDGSVYVYRLEGATWVEEQKLTPSDSPSDGFFGSAVSLRGDIAVIGAPGANSRTGAAYVFRFDGTEWMEEQKLIASDGADFARYGDSVSVSGGAVLIGATTAGNSSQGAAYVYRFDGTAWGDEEKLVSSDLSPGDSFGSAVSLEGDLALVGAVGGDVLTGAAYVFRFDGSAWIEEQKLVADEREFNDQFGADVSLSGSVALIAAWGDDLSTGAAYAFAFDGISWSEGQKLTPSDLETGDGFGRRVDVRGSTALISSSSGSMGSAYVFRLRGSTWSEEQKLTTSNTTGTIGADVALSDDLAFVGSSNDNNARGSAFLFSITDCLAGTVNAGNDFILNVLFIEGEVGGEDRTVEITEDDFFDVSLVKPANAGNGKFVLHANLGEPVPGAGRVLPFDIGLTCFPVLLTDGASPVIVANNIGKRDLVGASDFFGVPQPDPDAATTTFSYPPLPIGTTLTFQAVIVDTGAVSSKSVSATNGVVLKVQ